jgi:hypothetical protein
MQRGAASRSGELNQRYPVDPEPRGVLDAVWCWGRAAHRRSAVCRREAAVELLQLRRRPDVLPMAFV